MARTPPSEMTSPLAAGRGFVRFVEPHIAAEGQTFWRIKADLKSSFRRDSFVVEKSYQKRTVKPPTKARWKRR